MVSEMFSKLCLETASYCSKLPQLYLSLGFLVGTMDALVGKLQKDEQAIYLSHNLSVQLTISTVHLESIQTPSRYSIILKWIKRKY
jgi:hypothetical protein